MTEDEASTLEEMLAAIGEIRGSLKPGERSFCDDVSARYEEQGADLFLTPRQWAWLASINEKA